MQRRSRTAIRCSPSNSIRLPSVTYRHIPSQDSRSWTVGGSFFSTWFRYLISFALGLVNSITSNSPRNWDYGYGLLVRFRCTAFILISELTPIIWKTCWRTVRHLLSPLRLSSPEGLPGRTRYYGPHYPRLQALKKKFDPHDLFDFPVGVEE